MWKIKITPDLGSKLKEFRIQYKVKSKDLAEYIGKSPAYITKLEKGEILQIDRNEFVNITNFITNSTDGYDVFFEKVSENLDFENLEKETFFLNFDMVERRIPIPDELIEYINRKMCDLQINIESLVDYINQNEDLGENFLKDHNIKPEDVDVNIWYQYYEADSQDTRRHFIFLKYSEDRVNDLITYKIHKCEYLFIYAIVYHLLKYECKSKGHTLNDNLLDKLTDETEKLLSTFKFYSLHAKYKISNQVNNEDELNKLLNNFEIDNLKYINIMLSNIKYLSDLDVEYTNSKLKQIVDNFNNNDRSFILSFMAISLLPLKEASVTKKREFIKSITEFINSFDINEENIDKY